VSSQNDGARIVPARNRLAWFGFFVHALFVTAAPPLDATHRFALIMEGRCQLVTARGGRGLIAGPLVCLIWTRLRRMAARFSALAAQVRSGALPSPSSLRTRAASRPARPHPPQRLPNRFAWLVRLAGSEAACFAGQMQHLLSDPEMVALLSAAPQMGRVLRPLCRMLGVKPSPDLLPPRSRDAGPAHDACASGAMEASTLPGHTPERPPRAARGPAKAALVPGFGGFAPA
jgi:hypothetical protein